MVLILHWNDNNEFEVWDNMQNVIIFGRGMPIKLLRPLQPLLMMKSSYEAQLEYAPNKRPYLISVLVLRNESLCSNLVWR